MKKIVQNFIGISFLLLITFNSNGQNQVYTINSNLLSDYGISPKVLDAALSTTLQEGSFKQKIVAKVYTEGKTDSAKFLFIYDPKYKEGIDIQVVYKNDSLGPLKEKELLKTMQEMHSFSRLSKSNLYDENSLKVISSSETSVILSFKYNSQILEPELKYGKKVTGKIFITNGVLEKVELTNDAPVKFLEHKIESGKFVSTSWYTKLSNSGGYIVKSTSDKYSYKKKGKDVSVDIEGRTLDYKNTVDIPLSWENKPAAIDYGPEYKTISGSLGWGLPFYGKGARKLGYSLPRPIGINVFSHQQAQQLQFTDLSVGANNSELISLVDLFELEGSAVDQITKVTMIKADVWLLPFLNIMGVFGQGKNSIDGSLYLDEEVRSTLSKLSWLIGLEPDDIPEYLPIKSQLSALTYGAGLTLAGGIDNINVSLSYQFVASSIPEVNTTKLAHVLAPALGYMTPFGMNIMVGAQGQYYDTNTTGFINLPGDNRLDYQVNFEPIKWNFMFGLYVPISNHLELAVQSGWGKRRSLTVVFGYRL